jgi:hypothetical protein
VESLTSELVTTGVVTITAPVFYIAFQESDSEVASTWSSIFTLQNAELASRLSSQSAASAASVLSAEGIANSTVAGPSVSTSATVGSDNKGISGGAIAGIVVGAVAGLLFLMGAVLLVLRRRRNAATMDEGTSPNEANEAGEAWNKPELDSKAVGRVELDNESHEIKELQAPVSPPVELPGHESQQPEVSELGPSSP